MHCTLTVLFSKNELVTIKPFFKIFTCEDTTSLLGRLYTYLQATCSSFHSIFKHRNWSSKYWKIVLKLIITAKQKLASQRKETWALEMQAGMQKISTTSVLHLTQIHYFSITFCSNASPCVCFISYISPSLYTLLF